jgi:hypothetical protein
MILWISKEGHEGDGSAYFGAFRGVGRDPRRVFSNCHRCIITALTFDKRDKEHEDRRNIRIL